MTTTGPHVHDDELAAYVDDELPPARALDVAEHLTACADCSAAYEAMLATVARLREDLVYYPAPDTLRVRVRAALRESARSESARRETAPASHDEARPAPAPARTYGRRRWALGVAAAVALAAVSSGATLVATRAGEGATRVEQEVVASHIRSLMPDHLTDVRSNDQHNVKPWFNGRLDFSPTVPRLDSLGFPLLGGRLDYVGGRPVAVVVYGRRKHVINAYSWPASGGDTREARDEENGYHTLHWRDGGVEHWLVSDLNPSELAQFAGLLRAAPR
jgi:anti-sigma factor RsiW